MSDLTFDDLKYLFEQQKTRWGRDSIKIFEDNLCKLCGDDHSGTVFLCVIFYNDSTKSLICLCNYHYDYFNGNIIDYNTRIIRITKLNDKEVFVLKIL